MQKRWLIVTSPALVQSSGCGTDAAPDRLQPKVISSLLQLTPQFTHLALAHMEPDLHRCLHTALHSEGIQKTGLFTSYQDLLEQLLSAGDFSPEHSLIIGTLDSATQVLQTIPQLPFAPEQGGWASILATHLHQGRYASQSRTTKETDIQVQLWLDQTEPVHIHTGLGFFDHMLEQIAKHAGIALHIQAKADLHVDAHHCIEDVGITFASALRKALGTKAGIARFGMALPMDETRAEVLLDLSGRAFCKFEGSFIAPMLGELPTEMISHFYRSVADALQATVHVSTQGENDHHKCEASFKAFGRALRMAIARQGSDIPSTKGTL